MTITFRANHIARAVAGTSQAASTVVSRKPKSAKSSKYNYQDDPALIGACIEGDDLAWNQLVARYAPLVYSIPRRMGLSTADADDVLQNVFAIVFRYLSRLQNQICLAAWLITITRRECLHYSKRIPDHASLFDEIVDGGNHLADRIEQHEQQELVHRALSQLDPTSQALISALFLEVPTPSYIEIATRLGLAVGSIGPARARCLKKLETILLDMDRELAR